MKTLLLTLLLFAYSCAFAQQHRFADSTAQWNVLEYYTGFAGDGYVSTLHFSANDDTLLNNQAYQIIDYDWRVYPLESNGKFYIRKDSTEKVYGRINVDSADYLLYDFGKLPGDSFVIHDPRYLLYPTVVHVDSVANTFHGQARKVMHVSTSNEGVALNYKDVFVEGVGSLHSFFLYPGVMGFFIDGETYSLLCYSDNDTLVYRNQYYTTCDYDTAWTWNSIDELASVGVKISPNPATDLVQVQLHNTNGQTMFELSDITGRSVLQQQLNEPATNIPVDNLSKGVYLYTIRNNHQRISSGKVILE
ncbi:MAG TPA: T9SS type A sorting domain-containing protein [Chitinophagales bacterium]|nr:T9SS type A sorting domain-containing protein [Chitinophagales bacterium]